MSLPSVVGTNAARSGPPPDLRPVRAKIRRKYDDVVLVLAPPRSASTALARVFWKHPRMAYYAHEPFDRVYHLGEPAAHALDRIEGSLELASGLGLPAPAGRGLLVKEMAFQVHRHFSLLVDLPTRPIVFLIRDPRLSIRSRMEQLRRATGSPAFPIEETGWRQLPKQVAWCRRFHVPHVIVDATEFRAAPAAVLARLSRRLGFSFSERQLRWRPISGVALGALGGRQAAWYDRVLGSSGIVPPGESVPSLEVFEEIPGLREHVEEACLTYRRLLASREALRRDAPAPAAFHLPPPPAPTTRREALHE